MTTCRICLRGFGGLRFQTDRISICGRCVNALNGSPEVAKLAEDRLGDLLRRGMERNAERDLTSNEPWKRDRASRLLKDFASAHAKARPHWLNRLLADPGNTGRDFKIVRAFRRGLIHYDRPAHWGYPSNWKDVASRIRGLDGYRCVKCGQQDQVIHVHHIVYVSNFGTHQQPNLVSLCCACHEAEHQRAFDFGECAPAAVHPDEYPADPKDSAPSPSAAHMQVSTPSLTPERSPRSAPVQAESPAQQRRIEPRPSNQAVPNPSQATAQPAAEAVRERRKVDAGTAKISAASLTPAGNTATTAPVASIAPRMWFCGQCRTLVAPRRRFLFFKVCPTCGLNL